MEQEFSDTLKASLAPIRCEGNAVEDLAQVHEALTSESSIMQYAADPSRYEDELTIMAAAAARARHYPLMRMLEDFGARLDEPAVILASVSNAEICSYVHSIGGYDRRRPNPYDTALMLAAAMDREDVVAACLRRSRYSEHYLHMAIMIAASVGRKAICAMLDYPDPRKHRSAYATALKYAALRGNVDAADMIMSCVGAKALDLSDGLALYCAVYSDSIGSGSIVGAIMSLMRPELPGYVAALDRARQAAELRGNVSRATMLAAAIAKHDMSVYGDRFDGKADQ